MAELESKPKGKEEQEEKKKREKRERKGAAPETKRTTIRCFTKLIRGGEWKRAPDRLPIGWTSRSSPGSGTE